MDDAMPSPMSTKSDEKFYPSLHLDWDDDYKLPESGTMTIKFTKTSESNSKNRDGKKRQSVSLDITSIENVSGKKSESKDEDDGGEALDKHMKDAKKKEDESEEEDY